MADDTREATVKILSFTNYVFWSHSPLHVVPSHWQIFVLKDFDNGDAAIAAALVREVDAIDQGWLDKQKHLYEYLRIAWANLLNVRENDENATWKTRAHRENFPEHPASWVGGVEHWWVWRPCSDVDGKLCKGVYGESKGCDEVCSSGH